MTSESILAAINNAEELAHWRSTGRDSRMIPPPNHDIAVTIYESNHDGTYTDTPVMSFVRPQDFAVNDEWSYTLFGYLQNSPDGKTVSAFLIHLYWDGPRSEENAIKLVLDNRHMLGYGQWEPTAPSDPLHIDDFWPDDLPQPPMWDHTKALFDNFARKPYKWVQIDKDADTDANTPDES